MCFYSDEPPVECWQCDEKNNKIDDIKYWFRAVLEQLYGQEEFDAKSLENCLDELSGFLDMKLPKQQLAVVGHVRDDMSQLLDGWQKYNKEFFNQLAKVGA